MMQQKSLKLNPGMLVLVVLCLVLMLAGVANAAEYTRYGVLVSVADGPGQVLNTVAVNVKAGELRAGDTVFITLPNDFKFNGGDWSKGEGEGNIFYGDYDTGCSIYVPWNETNGLNMAVDSAGEPVATDIFTVDQLRDNELKLQVNSIPDYPSLSEDGYFFIYLKDVDIPSKFRGAIQLSFDAPPGSGFGNGDVSGGRVGILDPEEDEEDVTDPEEDTDKEPDAGEGDGDLESDENGLKAVFVLGKAAYTLNDVQYEMDVASYVKEGRTYLPMRYVAQALGIENGNILWKNGTATFIGADRRVSVSLGSRVMYVDGTQVIMDVEPEIHSGRTMLPIRWIATAFGVDATWDSATQTVTVE